MEYRDCPQHRSIMLKLCAVVQNITLRCPTALVWNWLGDGKTSIFICESPLDILPCSPSVLPMLPAPNNHQIRSQLRACEDLICSRSLATEVNWSSDKCQKTHMGRLHRLHVSYFVPIQHSVFSYLAEVVEIFFLSCECFMNECFSVFFVLWIFHVKIV